MEGGTSFLVLEVGLELVCDLVAKLLLLCHTRKGSWLFVCVCVCKSYLKREEVGELEQRGG